MELGVSFILVWEEVVIEIHEGPESLVGVGSEKEGLLCKGTFAKKPFEEKTFDNAMFVEEEQLFAPSPLCGGGDKVSVGGGPPGVEVDRVVADDLGVVLESAKLLGWLLPEAIHGGGGEAGQHGAAQLLRQLLCKRQSSRTISN